MVTLDELFEQRYGRKGTEFLENNEKVNHVIEGLMKMANEKGARIIATFMTGDIFYNSKEIGRQVEKASKNGRFLLVLSNYDSHDFRCYEEIGAQIFRLHIDEPSLFMKSPINPELWDEAIVASDGNNYHELVYIYPHEIGKERIGRHSSDSELVKMIFEEYRENVAKPLYDRRVQEFQAHKSLIELEDFMKNLCETALKQER